MTLVGANNPKVNPLNQDGPAELAPANPLVSEGNKPSEIRFDDEVPNPGGPWKPSASHNAWTE